MRFLAISAAISILLFGGCTTPPYQQGNEERFALENARIIDGTGDAPIERGFVLIEGNTILEVASGPAPSGIRTVDLAGKTILPGLIDAHQHLATRRSRDGSESLPDMLRSGVTSIRDMGGDLRELKSFRDRISRGEMPGPRIHASAVLYGPAFLSDPRSRSQRGFDRGTAPWNRLVTEASNLDEIMRNARLAGADGIKIYTNVPASLLGPISAAARKEGLRVWSHSAPLPARPRDAVEAGVQVLSHAGPYWATEVAEDWPDSTTDGYIQWATAQDFASIDPAAPVFRSVFARMAERRTILEPTLAAPLGFRRAAERLADRAPAGRRPAPREAPEDWEDFKCRLVRAAHAADVPIAAGVDGFGDVLIVEEIKLLSSCGLDQMEAIVAATATNAEVLGQGDRLGTLEPGKLADILVVDGDPLESLSSLNAPVLVVKDGILVDPAD